MPLQTVGGALLRIPAGGALARECCCVEALCPPSYVVTVAGLGNGDPEGDYSLRNGVHTVHSSPEAPCGPYVSADGYIVLAWDGDNWRLTVYRAAYSQYVVFESPTAVNEASAVAADYTITGGTPLPWLNPWMATAGAEVSLP